MGSRRLAWLAVGCLSCTAPPRSGPPAATPPSVASRSTAPPPEPPSTDAAPHGDCTPDGWCWENPLPRSDELKAVWGSAPNDYFAGGNAGALLHFDGSRWSPVDSAKPFDVRRLYGRGPHDVWALGVSWGEPLMHWDGATWSRPPTVVPSPRTGGFGEDGTPWVIDDRGGVWRFDGARWQSRLPASCHADGCGWYTVRTASGGTLTGRPSGADWDGTRTFNAPNFPDPTGRTFGGTRESHFLLLQYGTAPYVEVWHQGRWIEEPLPDAATPREQRPALRSIWGASDDDVWAVGDHGALIHFDGTAWTPFDSGTRTDLADIWGTGHSDAWAVGDAALIHWDGHAWTPARTTLTESTLNAVWALGGCTALAAGDAGTVLRRDCTGWHALPSGVTSDLLGVWASDATNAWLVGKQGTLLHFDGRAFERVPAPTVATLNDVWGTGPRDIWAVGDDAVTLHFDGKRWQKTPNPLTHHESLLQVRGTAPDHVLVVGERGAFAAWDGRTWTPRGAPCTGVDARSDKLNAVLPLELDDWLVACDQVGILHGALATSWSEGASGRLTGLARAGTDLFAVGPYQLWQRTGAQWSRVTAVGAPLRAIAGAADGQVIAVGEHGVVLSRVASVEPDGKARHFLDLPKPYEGELIDDIALPASQRKALEAVRRTRANLERVQEAEREAEQRALVELSKSMSLRDAGALLGFSRQRAHQVLRSAKGR